MAYRRLLLRIILTWSRGLIIFQSFLERVLGDLIVTFVLFWVLEGVSDHVKTILSHPWLHDSSLLLELAREIERRGRTW